MLLPRGVPSRSLAWPDDIMPLWGYIARSIPCHGHGHIASFLTGPRLHRLHRRWCTRMLPGSNLSEDRVDPAGAFSNDQGEEDLGRGDAADNEDYPHFGSDGVLDRLCGGCPGAYSFQRMTSASVSVDC